MSLAQEKAAARKAALARRKAAHGAAGASAGTARLIEALMPYKSKVIAGYMPIRTEIDPRPAMAALAVWSPICVPVIEGADQPLSFRQWTPGCALKEGAFGAQVPTQGAWLTPDVLIVPLVAFTRHGARLGYGGGFYDRTLEMLRAERPVTAIGYAYGAQEADSLPQEETDQPLDLIVTDKETLTF